MSRSLALGGLLTVLLAGLLAGCSNWQTTTAPEPSTYDTADIAIPRKVGLLRTLLFLPAVRALPVRCKGSAQNDDWRYADDDAPVEGGTIAWAINSFERRGYALVDRKATVISADDPIDWTTTLVALRRAAEAGAAESVPADAALLARKAGSAAKADGIALFLHADTCQRASRSWREANWLMENVFQLGLPHVLGPSPEAIAPQQEALVAIFETRSGRMVWRSYRYSQQAIRGTAVMPELFDALEPAVPAILTR